MADPLQCPICGHAPRCPQHDTNDPHYDHIFRPSAHEHRYDTVVEWESLAWEGKDKPWSPLDVVGRRATRVMCSRCLDVQKVERKGAND